MIPQQRLVSYEIGPKGGPRHDLGGWVSFGKEIHKQRHSPDLSFLSSKFTDLTMVA